MGRYRCPNCGRERPEPAVAADAGRAGGHGRRAGASCARRPGELELRLPLPGLYNVYNAVAAAALALELGVPLDDVARRAGGLRRRLRPRGDDRPSTGAPVSILLVKNPAGANEVLRTLTLEDGAGRPVARAQRPHRRRARRLLDLGRRLRAARRARAPRDLLGHARRGDGAAAQVRGHRRGVARRPRPGRSLDAAVRGRPRPGGRCTRCPPTPRCSSCATLLADRGLRRAMGGVSERVGVRLRLAGRSTGARDDAGEPAARLPARAGAWRPTTAEAIPGYKTLPPPRGRLPAGGLRRLPRPGARPSGATSTASSRRCDAEQLARLDERERNYDRVDVTELIDGSPADGSGPTSARRPAGGAALEGERAGARGGLSGHYLDEGARRASRRSARTSWRASSASTDAPTHAPSSICRGWTCPPRAGADDDAGSRPTVGWHDVECALLHGRPAAVA